MATIVAIAKIVGAILAGCLVLESIIFVIDRIRYRDYYKNDDSARHK